MNLFRHEVTVGMLRFRFCASSSVVALLLLYISLKTSLRLACLKEREIPGKLEESISVPVFIAPL